MSKKYHEQHPTISFRCKNLDEYNLIKNMVKNSGKTESTFIREILLDAEKQESQSFNSGYNKGFNDFAITCFICGETMIINLNSDRMARNMINKTFRKILCEECFENQKKREEAKRKARFREMYFGD